MVRCPRGMEGKRGGQDGFKDPLRCNALTKLVQNGSKVKVEAALESSVVLVPGNHGRGILVRRSSGLGRTVVALEAAAAGRLTTSR